MPTMNEYFAAEAREFLRAIERSIERTPATDPGELHRAVRALRGTAQLARHERIFRVVAALEASTRMAAAGVMTWGADLAAKTQETVADLRALLEGAEGDDEQDARAREAAARWRRPETAAPTSAPAAPRETGIGELRAFTAREAGEITTVLDRSLVQLQAEPMNREPLREILRRQRALLGSARLDDVPVVAEILRAIEDLTRVIARLDIGVKQEWLDVYRVARDALQGTVAPLLRGEDPQPTHASSRLRHMRAELLDRYGSEDGPQPHEIMQASVAAPGVYEEPPTQRKPEIAATVAAAAEPDEGDVLELDEASIVAVADEPDADVVSIDELVYTRDAALRRALELRAAIARAAAADPAAQEAVDELFDLIDIALA